MAQGIHWDRGYMNAWSVEETVSFMHDELALSDDAWFRANNVNGKMLAALVDGHDNGHARLLLPMDQVLLPGSARRSLRARPWCAPLTACAPAPVAGRPRPHTATVSPAPARVSGSGDVRRGRRNDGQDGQRRRRGVVLHGDALSARAPKSPAARGLRAPSLALTAKSNGRSDCAHHAIGAPRTAIARSRTLARLGVAGPRRRRPSQARPVRWG